MEFDVDLDDELLARALEISRITNINNLFRFAIEENEALLEARRDEYHSYERPGEND